MMGPIKRWILQLLLFHLNVEMSLNYDFFFKSKTQHNRSQHYEICPWVSHLSFWVCFVGTIVMFVTIACRVLLTFPSAVECVWKPFTRLTPEIQCHLHISHGRTESDSIVVIPVMPRHQWQKMSSLWCSEERGHFTEQHWQISLS